MTAGVHSGYGWLWCLAVGLACCAAFNETFDGDWVDWVTPQHHFQLYSGLEAPPGRGYPQVDDTTGTGEGRFLVATGAAEKGGEDRPPGHMVYSACLNPTGPRCTLHFSTWLAESRQGNEGLEVYVLPFCHYCGQRGQMRETRGLPFGLHGHSPANHTGRWVRREVEVGAVHSLFLLALVADVADNDSLLAIDSIYMTRCQLEPGEAVCGEREFQCPHTALCVPRHHVCDLHPDCQCGEDEIPAVCEHLPPHGRARFTDCDLAAGGCFWYNVSPPDPRDPRDPRPLPWAHARPAVAVLDRALPRVNQSGPYVYVSAVGVQTSWRSWWLRSVDFPPLPLANGLCALRFSYLVSGAAELTVQLWEVGGGAGRTLRRLNVSHSGPRVWQRAAVTVNTHSVPTSYVLQLQAQAFPGPRRSAVAVTNLTLSPECFPQPEVAVTLSTCRAEGREGPTPLMCGEGGRGEGVTVLTHPPTLKGLQQWTVVTSGKYSISAYGARGGRGREGTASELNYGAHASGTFRLTGGDTLMAVVGQTGHDCPVATEVNGSSQSVVQSGGGGGGATFVYRRRAGQEPELLMMAGGGGGLDYLTFDRNLTGPLTSGQWERDVPWATLTDSTDFRGRNCTDPSDAPSPLPLPLPAGGYGAGWGACGPRGAPGGGGEVSTNSGAVGAGTPGPVFIHPLHLSASFTLRSHPGEGVVEVTGVGWGCPCDFLCRWNHPYPRPPQAAGNGTGGQEGEGEAVACLCPAGRVLAPDGVTCLDLPATELVRRQEESRDGGVGAGMAAVAGVIAVIVIVIVTALCYSIRRTKAGERLGCVRLLLSSYGKPRSPTVPLRALAPSSLPTRLVQHNPHYTSTHPRLPHNRLPQIPRDHLRVGGQLGQGAFGEVYKGFLSGMTGTEREVPVAIKTLPPVCSEQTELDFFMEAFIVSKFRHGNIVAFLGVCFQQAPRYIVLELLAGGNLKAFLGHNRPAQGEVSSLTVGDLLSLALDICCGCCYLERQHFIHRDIAARNCLLTSTGPDRVAKIADFGMSRDVYRSDYYKKEGRAVLPVKWMPPEALTEGLFTTKTDVWSFGVLLWETMTLGYTPYPTLTNSDVINFIYIGGRLPCPEGCPTALYDLMSWCWKQKSEERPSFTDIQHTLTSISQDRAVKCGRVTACGLSAIPCTGRGPLQLLNHPVPSLPHPHPSPPPSSSTLSPPPSSSALSPADPCSTQPLLPLRPSPTHRHGARGGGGGGGGSSSCGVGPVSVFRAASPAAPSPRHRASYSSLDPLLPPDTDTDTDFAHRWPGEARTGDRGTGDGHLWGHPGPDHRLQGWGRGTEGREESGEVNPDSPGVTRRDPDSCHLTDLQQGDVICDQIV